MILVYPRESVVKAAPAQVPLAAIAGFLPAGVGQTWRRIRAIE
jgi:hypothetical protein